MRRAAELPAQQKRVLQALARAQFATQAQLARLTDAQPSHTSTAINALLDVGLVDGTLTTRPAVLHLTSAGARLAGVVMPSGRRQASWSVMAHACHLTEAAASLAASNPGFRFLSRLELLRQGFNPGHGEHGAIDASGTAWFVLLDDYQMGSDRIARAWSRRHRPNPKHWPDPTGKTWREVVQRFLVVTTDPDQAERHQLAIDAAHLPADLLVIEALWK